MPKLIDLSMELFHRMPVHPAMPPPVIADWLTHPEVQARYTKGFHTGCIKWLGLVEHTGTHVDALNHVDPSPDAPSIDQLPLELFFTEAICVDVSHVEPGTYITVQDIQQALKKHGLEIKRGDTFIYYTAHHERFWGKPEWNSLYSGLSRESAEWLADQGVVNIGCESVSIDCSSQTRPDSDPPYPAHAVCRERRLLNMELLWNLDKVVGKRFRFIGFPIKIKGGTGSPIRAVALLDD